MLKKLRQWEDTLGWKHDGWWAKTAFLLVNYLLALPELFYKPLSATVRLASTHYSVAGTAWETLKHGPRNGGELGPISSFGWVLLLVWCVPVATALVLILYPFKRLLSADKCDVCSRVAFRTRLIRLAWRFVDSGFRCKDMKSHTRGFLWMTRAEVYIRRTPARKLSGKERELIHAALACADEAERDGEYNQAGRLYKQAAALFVRLDDIFSAEVAWNEARRLFGKTGARDQLLKLGPCP